MRFIVCLLALAALAVCPGCGKPKSKAEQLCEKAVEQKDLQRYDEAQRLFRRAVDADPAFDKPYFELGEMNEVVLGNYAESVTWYEKFLGVTKNEEMKKKVSDIVKDLRNELRTAPAGTGPGGSESIAGPAKGALDKALVEERAKLEREFSIRQKAFAAQKDREFDQLKEELRKLKSDNIEFENKVRDLKIERDAAAKKAETTRGQEEIAKLLTSTTFTGTDKERELGQKLLELQAANDKARADFGTERAKTQQVEAKLVRLQQQVGESGHAAPADPDAQKRMTELQDENKRLTEQVSLLKRSADDASSAVTTRADSATRDTIARLKSDLADAAKEKEQLKADKQRAEDDARAMKKQADDLASAATSSNASGVSATDDNRKLRLQIEKITGEYNDLSAKLTASEQHSKTIEDDLEKLRTLQPATKDAAEGGFSDLSDEIKKMQGTIDTQKRLIVKRDTDINSLTEQNIRLQRQMDGKQAPESSRQLIEELNQQLQARQDRIDQLNRDLEQAKAGGAASADAVNVSSTTPMTGSPVSPAPPTALPGSTPTTRASAGTPAATHTAAALPHGTRTYRVQSGDTLGIIAQKAYGDRNKWMQIFNYNRKQLPTASALRVGMDLYIPPAQP